MSRPTLQRVLSLALLCAASALPPARLCAQAPTARVNGQVFDSLARAPLVGAMVQLVASDTANRYGHTVVADALGRFAFDSVPDGSYLLGFYHPLLDSLGIEPMVRSVRIASQKSQRADLGIPSAKRFRDAICGANSRGMSEGGGVLVGVVHDARDHSPQRGVKVAAHWLEYSIAQKTISRSTARVVDSTRANGWFALCNVPSGGTVALMASRGADSTDLIELDVPADGYVRRELYLDQAGGAKNARAVTSFHGAVVTGPQNRPVAGATVSVAGSASTRTDSLGRWVLSGAPAGTRVLQVRAVGYFPSRTTVDFTSSDRSIQTSLSNMKEVLDTVRVRADRIASANGFNDRRRMGQGRYLTAEDIERRQPIETSDLFRSMSGVQMYSDTIFVRGGVDDQCQPGVYINGMYFWTLTASEIDLFVKPKEISGIEVYTGASAPPQFQQGLSGCGSIVIWTKPPGRDRQ